MTGWEALLRTEFATEVKLFHVRVKVRVPIHRQRSCASSKLRWCHASRASERQWPAISQPRLPPRTAVFRLVCKLQIKMHGPSGGHELFEVARWWKHSGFGVPLALRSELSLTPFSVREIAGQTRFPSTGPVLLLSPCGPEQKSCCINHWSWSGSGQPQPFASPIVNFPLQPITQHDAHHSDLVLKHVRNW